MKQLLILLVFLVCYNSSNAQGLEFSIGSDIPYQHYVGAAYETKHFNLAGRSGVLTPPYSDAILDIIQAFGTDEIYINLLDASFQFGWMNSIGANLKFGKHKSWYAGSELRLDYLTAADTPHELLEAITGEAIVIGGLARRNIELKMGLRLFGAGFRFGRYFKLGPSNKHFIKTELSFIKYLSTQTSLSGNGQNLTLINQELNKLIWDDVFKPYGFAGGIGLAYSYRFSVGDIRSED